MPGLIRLGAYILSGLAIWQAFQSGGGPAGLFPLGKRLVLDCDQAMIFGVCSGLSNYTGLDVSIIRLAWSLTVLYRGLGIGLYVLAFLIMPMPL